MTETPLTPRERRLVVKLRKLEALLHEPIQTIEAIRKGEVDAFVVGETEADEQVYVLKSADRLYQLIVESMGEGALTVSHDGAITYCNPQFVRLVGVDRSELLGRPLREFLTPRSRALLDSLLTSPEPSNRIEVELETKGGVVPANVISALIDDGDGSLCLIVHDLRNQRAREDLLVAKEAAEQANRSKDDFLAMVSHELRSPITVILGWTRMLQMNRLDRDTRKLAVESIQQSTSRLLKLVDDILDVSRLSDGRLTLQREVLDLRDCVRASVESVRFDVDQKSLHVDVRVPDEPVPVFGDPDRVQQIVVNLLVNAVKFTPAQGRVDVVIEAHDRVAQITVRDTGEGIAPEFLPFVFERFRQDFSSTTRAHRGLGLGLAIVRQLLEAHGGSVSAHSEGKGKGATFIVTLPLTSQQVAHVSAHDEEPLPSLDGRRVLLVDDEVDTVDVMRTILCSAGASVETATSAAQALEHAADFDPHVIVCDIAMPGEDGFQFLSRLSEHTATRTVPVLAITGKSSTAERDAILAAGFQSYLRKPIEPDELIRAIHGFAREE